MRKLNQIYVKKTNDFCSFRNGFCGLLRHRVFLHFLLAVVKVSGPRGVGVPKLKMQRTLLVSLRRTLCEGLSQYPAKAYRSILRRLIAASCEGRSQHPAKAYRSILRRLIAAPCEGLSQHPAKAYRRVLRMNGTQALNRHCQVEIRAHLAQPFQ